MPSLLFIGVLLGQALGESERYLLLREFIEPPQQDPSHGHVRGIGDEQAMTEHLQLVEPSQPTHHEAQALNIQRRIAGCPHIVKHEDSDISFASRILFALKFSELLPLAPRKPVMNK
jgi:hypothetical protein